MNSVPRWLILFLSAIALIAFLWYFNNIVTYLLMAGVLSIIGQPVVDFLAARRVGRFTVPRSLAAILTMVIMLLITLGLASVFIPLITREARIIAAIDPQPLADAFKGTFQRTDDFLQETGLLGNVTLEQYMIERLKGLVSFTSVTDFFNKLIGAMGGIFIAFASISFILFFFLKEKNLFYNIIRAIVPAGNEQKMDNVLRHTRELLARYIRGILLEIILLTFIIWLGLTIIGIKNALLIALFVAVFNIIPYIGPIIGSIIGIFLGVTSAFPMEVYPAMLLFAVKMGLVFWITQLIDNFLLQPFIFSSSVKAHPLEIFLVILAGGTVGGVFGMVLAVPAYTVLRVVLKEFFSEFKIVRELTGEM